MQAGSATSGQGGVFFNQGMVDNLFDRSFSGPRDQTVAGSSSAGLDPSLQRPPTSFLAGASPWMTGQAPDPVVPQVPVATGDIVSNPQGFLASLPSNGSWHRGEAPADRMQVLSRALSQLQTATTALMHDPNRTPAQINAAMNSLGTMQQALRESPVSFPAADGPQFSGGMVAMFDEADSYNRGQSDVEGAYSTATTSLQTLSDLVGKALNTPGSSSGQTITTGKWIHHTKNTDDLVGGEFNDANSALSTMLEHATRIRSQGNTIVNEGQAGILGPSATVSHQEGAPTTLKDEIPAIVAGAGILKDLFT